MKLKKLAASLLAAAMLFCGTTTTAFAKKPGGGCDSKPQDKVTVDVTKEWKGAPEGTTLPDSVTITVADKEVTLTKDKNWKGTVELPKDTDWNDLEKNITETIPGNGSENWELTKEVNVSTETTTKIDVDDDDVERYEPNKKQVFTWTDDDNDDFVLGHQGNAFFLWTKEELNDDLKAQLLAILAKDYATGNDSNVKNADYKFGNDTFKVNGKTVTFKISKIVKDKDLVTMTFSDKSAWSKFWVGEYDIETEEEKTYSIALTNTYKAPDEIKQDVTFTKKFALAEGIDSDHVPQTASFGFQLERIEDNSWPVADQTGFSYGDGKDIEITFKDVPVGTYILRENMGFARDWTTSIPNGVKVFVTKEGVTFGDNHEDTLVVTNTYTKTSTIPDTVSISVEKEWSDGNENHENDSITVIVNQKVGDKWIYAGKCAVLSKSNDWKYSFDGLFKYKADGKKEIEYTVEEEEVPDGYEAEVTGSVENGFTITNTYTGDPNVTFPKYFKLINAKEEDVAGHKFTFTLTPSLAELRETREGNLIKSNTVYYNANGVTVTFKDVPAGHYILKEILPEGVDGWETSIPDGVMVYIDEEGIITLPTDDSAENKFSVTNTYKKTDSTPIDSDDDEEEDDPDLTVKKVDSETGKLITEKATFRIYKKSGSKTLYYTGSGWSSSVEKAKEYSTKNGKFTAYDLGAGTYYVEEVKAPSGYNLGDDLKVKLTSKDKTVEFANSKAKQNPNTGALVLPVDLADAAVAAMTLGAAAWVISKSKK